MTKTVPVLAFAFFIPSLIAGCGADAYSSALTYGVRSDPLVLKDKLGDETFDPDRPGVFPIMLAKDLDDPFNPMHVNRQRLFKEELLRDPAGMKGSHRRLLERVLEAYFGRPAEPQVAGIDSFATRILKVDPDTLHTGSQMYRLHCLHCHGLTGDGRGPTARWVNPHPRDYRLGFFKFMSVDQSDGPHPPSRADLFRTLQVGIDGTAMPAFNMLAFEDLQALVSYVIHLSLRGKVEYDVIANAFDYDADKNKLNISEEGSEDPASFIEQKAAEYLQIAVKNWVESQNRPIPIAPYPYQDFDKESRVMSQELKDSIVRGHDLFMGKGVEKLECGTCHIDYGRQAKYRFDSWGTLVRPQNLTQPLRRGGNRPVDFYFRIHSGITGSGMPQHSKLQGNQIWDLVNFVQTLPYPAMRKAANVTID